MYPRRWVLANALQYIDKAIALGNVVQPAGGKKTLHDTNVPGTQPGPTEQPIFFARGNDPQGTY